jgi:HK97 family phage prohead protease
MEQKMTKHEVRAGSPIEIREGDDGKIRVSGYAAVFNQEADIGGWFREKIAPGAFKDAIGRDDVVFLVNHEGLPLARTRSGTLVLKEDAHGLHMSSELDPDDPEVKAIVPKMRRGDLDKMSIGFIPEVQEWDDSEDVPKRTIKQARLVDVSIVTFPAYDGTEIGLRSLQEHRNATNSTKPANAATRARLKMKRTLLESKAK